MLDVKKALVESECCMDGARAWLRKKGLAAAQKKAGRATSEGLVAIATELGAADRVTKLAIVELCCETDFVARNSHFQEVANGLAQDALAGGSGDGTDGCAQDDGSVQAQEMMANPSVAEKVALLSATMGENLTLRRAFCVSLPNEQPGSIAWYIHNSLNDTMGQIGSVVVLHGGGLEEAQQNALARCGKRLAMQVVAAKPQYLRREDVPSSAVEAETAVLTQEVVASGKPEKMVPQILKGKLGKWFSDTVCLDQKWVVGDIDDAATGKNPTVTQVVATWSGDCGGPVEVARVVRIAASE